MSQYRRSPACQHVDGAGCGFSIPFSKRYTPVKPTAKKGPAYYDDPVSNYHLFTFKRCDTGERQDLYICPPCWTLNNTVWIEEQPHFTDYL